MNYFQFKIKNKNTKKKKKKKAIRGLLFTFILYSAIHRYKINRSLLTGKLANSY